MISCTFDYSVMFLTEFFFPGKLEKGDVPSPQPVVSGVVPLVILTVIVKIMLCIYSASQQNRTRAHSHGKHFMQHTANLIGLTWLRGGLGQKLK